MMTVSPMVILLNTVVLRGSQSLLGVEPREVLRRGLWASAFLLLLSGFLADEIGSLFCGDVPTMQHVYQGLPNPICNLQHWAQTNLFSLPGNAYRHIGSLQWPNVDQHKGLCLCLLGHNCIACSHAEGSWASPQQSAIGKARSVWLEWNLPLLQFTDSEGWKWDHKYDSVKTDLINQEQLCLPPHVPNSRYTLFMSGDIGFCCHNAVGI